MTDSDIEVNINRLFLLKKTRNLTKTNRSLGNREFECHRKAHYNEFKMAKLLREKIKDDEDEEADEIIASIITNPATENDKIDVT